MSRRRGITETALLVATLLSGASADTQAGTNEAQVKAAFVYNFLKFVAWPEGTFKRPNDALVVAMVGDGPTAEATERLLAHKQVGERPLVLRHLKWDEPLTGVHAVLVNERDAKKLRRILEETASGGILSIGEGAEFATRGGVIALLVEERMVRFDIDTDAAVAARLKVSSKLLAVARLVKPDAADGGAR